MMEPATLTCIEHTHVQSPMRRNGATFTTPEQDRETERRNFRVRHAGCLTRAHAWTYWHGQKARALSFRELERAAAVRFAFAQFLKEAT